MKFKLGQKVKYKRYTKKIDMSGENYVGKEDFNCTYEEKIVNRREIFISDKMKIGYIVGKRRVLFRSTLKLEYNSDPDGDDYVDIVKQEYLTVYLVASNLRNLDYVREIDLFIVPKIEIIRF